MSNRVTLAQLAEMKMQEAAALPVDQLAMLLEDVANEQARIKSINGKLDNALHLRFVVLSDLPKKVTWDQDKLFDAVEKLEDMGEDPAGYIERKLSVPESKFTAWPPSLQSMFADARTVGTGKPSYIIERRKEAA